IIVVNKAGAITPAISGLLVRWRFIASYRATACFSRSTCDGRRCLLFCRRERQQNASDDAKKHHIRKNHGESRGSTLPRFEWSSPRHEPGLTTPRRQSGSDARMAFWQPAAERGRARHKN